MKRWLSPFSVALALVVAIVVFLWILILQRIPSPGDCVDLWNRPTNGDMRASAARFPVALVEGWDSKAGLHCSVLAFDREGSPWQMYVLWLASPDGLPPAYGPDIGGDSFGSGWFFEVPKPHRPNVTIATDGRLILD